MKVCLGGTFDILHKGHEALIEKAFEIAGKEGFVFIGLTKKKIQENKKVRRYDERKKDLLKFLKEKNWLERAKILQIEDRYGLATIEDYDAIVVSPGTRRVAEEINEIRKKKGLKELKIVEVPYVLAKDGKPISSTRIKNREIDRDGNLLK